MNQFIKLVYLHYIDHNKQQIYQDIEINLDHVATITHGEKTVTLYTADGNSWEVTKDSYRKAMK